MDIKVEKKGEITVLHCSGSLDAETVAVFRKKVGDLFDKGVYKYIVDASNLSFIDSMGLGALISLLRRTREKEGDVKTVSLSKDVRDIFNITRLNKLFEIYGNVDEAMSKFR